MPASPQPKIAVVGSLNIDYFTRVERFPQPGETVIGRELTIRFGGKGANQAVAASHLGAEVAMIGGVGDHAMGERYLERLAGFGIDVAGVNTVDGTPTGSAFINVDGAGENTIVVAAGANAAADSALVRDHAELMASADAVLLQNEVPQVANVEAVRIAREVGITVVYNPAPWDDARDVVALGADLLVVNELEAAQLPSADAFSRIVITRGACSTLAKENGISFEVPTVNVEPVDTVGAGDAFVGALAVGWARGVAFKDAIAFANRAAALTTLKLGAQEAMPSMAEVAALE